MKYILSTIGAAAVAQALIPRGNTCCFHLTASGGPGGPVGQLGDGQNRIGQKGLPEGDYCIDDNGGLTDGKGRGCILTPPTTQFQCDTGAKPTPGFSVNCDGQLTYHGSTTFYACPTGDDGGYNIYTTPPKGQGGCDKITLMADNDKCKKCPPSNGCPANLPSGYQFPHLIIPVDSANPDKAAGTSYDGEASGTISTIFDFDIPEADKGKTCTIEFLFPEQSQLQTSSYKYSGSGGFDFALLDSAATQSTSYSNKPGVKQDYGTFDLMPGNAYTIGSMACPAGQRFSVSMCHEGDNSLWYFQDYNPCPIGLYVTVS